jgi:hypothetical protein
MRGAHGGNERLSLFVPSPRPNVGSRRFARPEGIANAKVAGVYKGPAQCTAAHRVLAVGVEDGKSAVRPLAGDSGAVGPQLKIVGF